MAAHTTPLELTCPVRDYAWGQLASNSRIKQLVPAGSELPQHCAELWIGAHPIAPAIAKTVLGLLPLTDLIAAAPQELLGAHVTARFGEQLPFLFKVLSIAQPLSIQLHPDRGQAARLHAHDPVHYPDTNHKPELAIPISEVEMLYGFRPIPEIRGVLLRSPELCEVLGAELVYDVDHFAKHQETLSDLAKVEDALIARLYARVMHATPEMLAATTHNLYARLKKLPVLERDEAWILRLESEYPNGDVGLFCFYLQNIEHRRPGDAVFIGSNIPHAYLSGDLVECMANSDNVVRAGLTPKFKDVETLLHVTDYRARTAPHVQVDRTALGRGITYRTGAAEFTLESFTEPLAPTRVDTDQVELLFSLTAHGQVAGNEFEIAVRPGTALLVPAACKTYSLELQSGGLFRVRVGGQAQ